MAQAQVTITAVDRTQAAINSALRGMKTLERTAKVTAKAVNLAFGFFTGGLVVSVFGKIVEAAKKTEEGKKSIDNLNRALNDPALQSAASKLTSVLVSGFTKVVDLTAAVVRELTGMQTVEVQLTRAVAEVERIKKTLDELPGTGGAFGERLRKQLADQIAIIQKLNSTAPVKAEEAKKEVTKQEQVFLTPDRASIAAGAMANWAREIENDLIAASIEFSDQLYNDLQQTVGDIAEAIPEVSEEPFTVMQEFAKAAAQNIQSSFADFLFDPFENGLRGMLSGFLNVIRRMVAEIAAQEILKAIFLPFASGSGFFANFAKSITGKAMGGSVSANTPYIVGERGPELFVPGTSGGIVPNNKLGMGGGVTVAPVYNIDARGATADLQRSLPGILQENNRRIFDELDRRYGIGR